MLHGDESCSHKDTDPAGFYSPQVPFAATSQTESGRVGVGAGGTKVHQGGSLVGVTGRGDGKVLEMMAVVHLQRCEWPPGPRQQGGYVLCYIYFSTIKNTTVKWKEKGGGCGGRGLPGWVQEYPMVFTGPESTASPPGSPPGSPEIPHSSWPQTAQGDCSQQGHLGNRVHCEDWRGHPRPPALLLGFWAIYRRKIL